MAVCKRSCAVELDETPKPVSLGRDIDQMTAPSETPESAPVSGATLSVNIGPKCPGPEVRRTRRVHPFLLVDLGPYRNGKH